MPNNINPFYCRVLRNISLSLVPRYTEPPGITARTTCCAFYSGQKYYRQTTKSSQILLIPKIIPAECVYAVFEVKQSINACHVCYAQEKVASVRRLHRTSLPIPHAGGEYPAKPPFHIYGGLLTLESDWKPPLGERLRDALNTRYEEGNHLDLGCVAAHGYFSFEKCKGYKIDEVKKPTTAFLFKLISQLQFSGTVPMIDVQAYSKWLSK